MSKKHLVKSFLKNGIDSIKEGLEAHHWPVRPQSINLEITSICDSKCIHCPRHDMDRPMRPIDTKLLQKIVEEAAALEIPEICPNGFGEIMTIKNIEEVLACLDSQSHKFRIIINTNGFRMTEDKIESLIRHNVHLLNICLDGATAATTEAIRINLKLDQIEANVRNFMRIRRERGLEFPKIRLGMVVLPQNQHEVNMFIEKWKDEVDYLGVDGYSNRAGALTEKFAVQKTEASEPARASACVLPFRELNIWADGKAVLCCNDWNEEYVVGDVNTQSIAEIWHGGALTKARELHMSNRGAELDICKKCNYWKEPKKFTKLWNR